MTSMLHQSTNPFDRPLCSTKRRDSPLYRSSLSWQGSRPHWQAQQRHWYSVLVCWLAWCKRALMQMASMVSCLFNVFNVLFCCYRPCNAGRSHQLSQLLMTLLRWSFCLVYRLSMRSLLVEFRKTFRVSCNAVQSCSTPFHVHSLLLT